MSKSKSGTFVPTPGTEPRRTHARKTPERTPAEAPEARKAFQIKRPLPSMEGKTYAVVSDYAATKIDGRLPHISVWNIMRVLGLKPQECFMCDARETAKVAAAKGAGLRLVTVEDYARGTL